MNHAELVEENNNLKQKILLLEDELNELREKLKNYTAPLRSKKYYENHKEEILEKQKSYVVSQEKKKEYARRAYLKKKEKNQKDIKENI